MASKKVLQARNSDLVAQPRGSLEDLAQVADASTPVKHKRSSIVSTGNDGQQMTAEQMAAAGKTPSKRDRKLGHRRVDETGQVSYKKKPTSELMGCIQIGIGQCIGSIEPTRRRDILMKDFEVIESAVFPPEGSDRTPAHRYSTFKFKNYAPEAFRYFRGVYEIKPADYLISLCDDEMRELSNPGASGSVFFITDDDKFIVKTVQRKEGRFLQKLLPGYFLNLTQAENFSTLLPKFYAMHCYEHGGKNIRFVVMNNLLPSSIPLHEKYDLKGSTYKRKASKHELKKGKPTLKDLDFRERYPEGIVLEPSMYKSVLNRIERDCTVLESFKIIDYSLLLGIQFVERPVDSASDPESDWEGNVDRPRFARQGSRFGTDNTAPFSGIPAWTSTGEPLRLYFGIIDILQNWRLFKKVEHNLKATFVERDSISVHRPAFYSERFKDFICTNVFRKKPTLKKPRSSKSVPQRLVSVASGGQRPPDLLQEAGDGQGTIPRSLAAREENQDSERESPDTQPETRKVTATVHVPDEKLGDPELESTVTVSGAAGDTSIETRQKVSTVSEKSVEVSSKSRTVSTVSEKSVEVSSKSVAEASVSEVSSATVSTHKRVEFVLETDTSDAAGDLGSKRATEPDSAAVIVEDTKVVTFMKQVVTHQSSSGEQVEQRNDDSQKLAVDAADIEVKLEADNADGLDKTVQVISGASEGQGAVGGEGEERGARGEDDASDDIDCTHL